MLKTKKKNITVFISLTMVLFMILTACNNPAETPPAGNQKTAPAVSDPGSKDTFTVSLNIESIENLIGNPFVSPGIPFSHFLYDNLFDYAPFPRDTFISALGESFEEKGNDLVVKLKKDVKWCDGKPFTSKDVLSSFHIALINNATVWTYVDKVEAPDDYTVIFKWGKQGPVLKQMALETQINAPYHIYGKWSDQGAALISKRDANGKLDKASDEQRLKIREDLFTFKPKITEAVGTGAFVVENTTSSEVMMKKREDAWASKNIKFNKLVVMRYTNLEAYVPNAIAGKYDGEQAGTPLDVYEQIKKARPDMKTFFVPSGQQPTMVFNTSKYPVNDPLVRKAIAYLIDAKSILPVLEVGTSEPDTYISGMVPSFRNIWFSKDFLSKLTNYSHNATKAEELLKKAGWQKGSDGFWRDSKGQLVQLEVSSMNNWPTFFLGGDALVNQMNQFGLKAQFKPMEYGAYNEYLKNGQHTIGMQFVGSISYGHPWGAYKHIYRDNMVQTGLKDPKDTSSAVPSLKVQINTGETVDVYQLVDQLFYTIDKNEQSKIVEKLALATNEFVPIVTIGEKTVPYKLYHTDNKITGYPQDPKDPCWYGGSTAPVFSKLLKYGKMDVKK